ncbi:MAG: DUF4282 domain-containing protein [Candidatus Kryptoniota bacterium]
MRESYLEKYEGIDWGTYFSFQRMISNSIIKWIYVVGASLLTLYSLYEVVNGLGSRGEFSDVIIGIVAVTVGNLLWRVICEASIVLFSIHDVLVEIEEIVRDAKPTTGHEIK